MTVDSVLDAGIQACLQRATTLLAGPAAPAASADLPRRRAFALEVADDLAKFGTYAVDARTRIEEVSIPTALGAAMARVYVPARSASPLPTQLFLHGGGFVFGSARELVNDALLSRRAAETGLCIVSLDYALAPEHPYPVARDQAVAAVRHLSSDATLPIVDPARLGIGGNSAGASIAASAALLLSRDGTVSLRHVALEVPAVSVAALDLSATDDPTLAAQADAYPGLLQAYTSDGDTDAFIADSQSLEEYPPTLLMIAEHDVLRAGGELLARRLGAAGRRVETYVMPGHVHGSPSFTALSPAAREWQATVERELRSAYGTGGERGA